MEADMSFLGQSMDYPLDSSYSDFASQAGLMDPRSHLSFDTALAGKPSPGTPSQFLLTPSSLWDKNAFDDTAMDIFADFSETTEPVSEQPSQTAPAEVSKQISSEIAQTPVIKQESPTPSAQPQVTRRLTRATSSSSQATRKSIIQDKALASTETSKVKKPRAPAKRTTKRTKGQAKEKQVSEEAKSEVAEEQDDNMLSMDQPAGEENGRRNKFLERNRVAASKCRQKKKEWMHGLEETKNELEKTHNTLHETLNGLLAEIAVMKEHLMNHAQCGDPTIDQWFSNEARKFVESKTREDAARRPSSSSGSGETQQSSRSSVVQFSPTSSVAPPTVASPRVKEETFSYDYMPDDMFAETTS